MLFSANTAGAVCSAAGVGVCSAGAGVLELKAWRSLPSSPPLLLCGGQEQDCGLKKGKEKFELRQTFCHTVIIESLI